MSRMSCLQDFLQDRTAGLNCSGPAKIPAVLQDPEQDQQKTFIFVFFPGISMNLLSTAPQGLFSPKISLEMLPLPLLPSTPDIYTEGTYEMFGFN